jgi:hypothetical protein
MPVSDWRLSGRRRGASGNFLILHRNRDFEAIARHSPLRLA